MSCNHYYNLCKKGVGRAVTIRTVDGRVHHGVISHVTPTHVYLRPLGRNLGGLGYGYYGGWGWGFGAGIALGAIATLAFLPFFFW